MLIGAGGKSYAHRGTEAALAAHVLCCFERETDPLGDYHCVRCAGADKQAGEFLATDAAK